MSTRRFSPKRILVISLLVLSLLVLLGPFLIPVPALTNTRSHRDFADPDSQFIEIDGVEIHYKQLGAGDTHLILLHGFASSLFSWREVMAPLAETYSVLAFDRPAFGLTERARQWSGGDIYSAAYQPELVIKLMDALGIPRAILVGNSAGGTISMFTALEYPDRVQALVLVDPAVYTGGGTPSALKWLFQTPQMNHVGPLIARNIQNWGEDFAASAWHDPTRITPDIWAGYTQPTQVIDWDWALWQYTRGSQASGLSARLTEFTLPVLVITGDDDRIVPTAESVRLAEELPAAQLAVIPACGHVPHEECPELFLEAAQSFLASLP